MATAHATKVNNIKQMVDAASRMLKVQKKAEEAGKETKTE